MAAHTVQSAIVLCEIRVLGLTVKHGGSVDQSSVWVMKDLPFVQRLGVMWWALCSATRSLVSLRDGSEVAKLDRVPVEPYLR